MTAAGPPLLELRGVSKHFSQPRTRPFRPAPVLRAVEDVSLSVPRGAVLGLVGESGCGKSTLGRLAAGLATPTAGQVLHEGADRATLRGAAARDARLRVQMVFQDPYGSLNPRLPVSEIVGEAPRVHGLSRPDHAGYLDAQLRRAGIDPVLKGRYPHQFSGGQRQRIGIARALAVQPSLLVCDEAVSALDVSVQAQILNLFMALRRELDLAYLFISHDLGVVEHLSDQVAIMYLGRIVEQADVAAVFDRPNHPYTRALLAEAPRLDRRARRFAAIPGEVPSPLAPPPGCAFHPRCPHAFARCAAERPLLRAVAPGHLSACHLNGG